MLKGNDKQLIINHLKGDEKSLEILIQRYLKPIYGFVWRYVGNGRDAEDITQEVFVKVWRNLKKFDPRRSHFATLRGRQNKSFKTWIFSIAKNTCVDFLRKKKTLPFSEFENEEGKNTLAETLVDPTLLPAEIFERTSIAQTLNTTIQRLSPKYRSVLTLRYNNQLTFREIAESLGKPLQTVKSWHRRALAALKKLLPDF